MKSCTIHIVDDDTSVREALGILLKREGFRVKAYGSGKQFLRRSPLDCGCIVLDMRLGDMSGLDVLATLKRRGNSLPVIVLTAYGDIPTTVQAMRAGAVDYLTKTDNPALLVGRIKQVVSEYLVDENLDAASTFSLAFDSLTPREREVLKLAKNGLNTQAIAERMSVSPRTVEAHRSHIAKKFHVTALTEIFRLAAHKF